MPSKSAPSSTNLTEVFGPQSDIFPKAIREINNSVEESATVKNDYRCWMEFCESYLGIIENGELSSEISTKSAIPKERYLYSCRIYSGLIIDSILQEIKCENLVDELTEGVVLHSWILQNRCILEEERRRISEYLSQVQLPERSRCIDPLRDLIAEIIPKEVRHTLGAVYTPDWLVKHTLDRLDPNYHEGSFLDPACGTGVFLLKIINYLYEEGFSASEIKDNVVGVELTPLDTIISRFNYLWLLHDLGLSTDIDSIPVYNTDFVLGLDTTSEVGQQTLGSFGESSNYEFIYPGLNNIKLNDIDSTIESKFAENQLTLFEEVSPFDYVVGNPPWIAWENHGETYRNAIARRWEDEEIFTQNGWRSKVAAGKTDISSLFVYAAVGGYLQKDGEISFLLPINLFKNPSGGEGFRKFRTKEGEEFAPVLVEDLNGCQAFENRTTTSSIAVFKNGASPDYPVPYYLWTEKDKNLSKKNPDSFNIIEQVAQPAHEESTSSWINGSPEFVSACKKFTGENQYTARSGVNTGGANGLFHLKVLEEFEENFKIKNHSPRARKDPGDYEGLMEKDLVRPLLKGSDVSRFNADPSQHIFFPYKEKNPKNAIPEDELEKQYPNAYEFVSYFENFLRDRSEFGRWGGGEFYKLFRIGPYTFADYKVVWRQTGISTGIQSTVISNSTIVPDQKVPLIAVDNVDEAHYICGVLNSSYISTVLNSYLMIDASPGIMDSLRIPDWDNSELQREIAEQSKTSHQSKEKGISKLNDLVAELYNLTEDEKETLLS